MPTAMRPAGVISAWSAATPDTTQLLRAQFGYGSDETWRTALSARWRAGG